MQPFHCCDIQIVLGAIDDLKYKKYLSKDKFPLLPWSSSSAEHHFAVEAVQHWPVLWGKRSCSDAMRFLMVNRFSGCPGENTACRGLEPSLLTPSPGCHLQWDLVPGLELQDAATLLCQWMLGSRGVFCENETVTVEPSQQSQDNEQYYGFKVMNTMKKCFSCIF